MNHLSSTASSSGQHRHLSLGDLHRFTMDVAVNRVGKLVTLSVIIVSARPTSTYIGEETIAVGPVSEIAVRIMFRCVYPPVAQSRHVLVRMDPSMPGQALALRSCQILDITTTGNVAMEPVFKWMTELRPYKKGVDKGKLTSNNLLQTVPGAN